MMYFKHQSNMRHDIKLKRIIARYGLEGYGLYNLILESITESLCTESPMPDLQENCEDIAEFYNGNTAKINEMMNYMINQGLFDLNEMSGQVVCTKLYKFLDTSQTRSEQMRKMIKSFKEQSNAVQQIDVNLSETVSDKSDRTEENRIETEETATPIDKETQQYKIAYLLYSLHLKNVDPGFKRTDKELYSWSVDIERLNRIDGRSWQDIEALVKHVKEPGNFWNSNIMSGTKLRKQFPVVFAQMSNNKNKPLQNNDRERNIKKSYYCSKCKTLLYHGFCAKCDKVDPNYKRGE